MTMAGEVRPEVVPSYAELVERVRVQAARIEGLVSENEDLKQQNEDLKKRLFGSTSEKLDPQKLKLAAEAVKADAEIAEELPPEPKQEKRSGPHKGGGRKPVPRDLPVVEVIIDLPEDQKVCPKTGVPLVKINEIVTEEIAWVPGHHVRKRYIRYVYAHPQKLFGPINPPLPPRLLPGSGVGSGYLAHLIIAKFVDHSPFYQQEQIAARSRVEIDRHKMGRWSAEVAEQMKPLYRALKRGEAFASSLCSGNGRAGRRYGRGGRARAARRFALSGGPRQPEPAPAVVHFEAGQERLKLHRIDLRLAVFWPAER